MKAFVLLLLCLPRAEGFLDIFGALFCGSGETETGCLFGFFGMIMNNGETGDSCEESCVLFRFFQPTWECGLCLDNGEY